jgi:hypothetical protein
MGVKLQSALGGSVELNAPSTASNFTMTVPAGNGTVATTDQLISFRNRIINGDMRIAQRGTSFTSVADGIYTLDRWISGNSNDGAVTVTQSTDAPTGFQNSLRVTVTTADTSIGAAQYGGINGRIEGYNVADLVTSTFVLSFWVRSSKTGTHCASIRTTAGTTYSYIGTYTIIQANTWEYKSIVVTGGIAAGSSINTGNLIGLNIWFTTASGSTYSTATSNSWVSGNFISTTGQVNVHDTVGNIFAITGVQLEAGSVATPFERRPYGTELALCQRYFQASTVYIPDGASLPTNWFFKVSMRATPTITNGGAGYLTFNATSEMVSHRQTSATGLALSASAEL